MKKLMMAVCVLLILGGCGSKDKIETTTCTSKMTQNGFNMVITIKLEHDGKKVNVQNQKGVVTSEDKDTFAQVKSMMEGVGFTEKTKGMEGVTYQLTSDENNLTVEESLIVDFSKVSSENYKIVTNGEAETGDNGKFYIDFDKTITGLEGQGFVCD